MWEESILWLPEASRPVSLQRVSQLLPSPGSLHQLVVSKPQNSLVQFVTRMKVNAMHHLVHRCSCPEAPFPSLTEVPMAAVAASVTQQACHWSVQCVLETWLL